MRTCVSRWSHHSGPVLSLQNPNAFCVKLTRSVLIEDTAVVPADLKSEKKRISKKTAKCETSDKDEQFATDQGKIISEAGNISLMLLAKENFIRKALLKRKRTLITAQANNCPVTSPGKKGLQIKFFCASCKN